MINSEVTLRPFGHEDASMRRSQLRAVQIVLISGGRCNRHPGPSSAGAVAEESEKAS
jgi:hypothetical protein